jgi:N-acetylglucosaminyldiphosphoundecaprenol N-acetyl-beta-D-mannosaminyltransferase
LGGPKDTLATQKELEKRFKNIKVNIWSGFYEESSESELVKDIASKNLDVLFCAMGFPKQEKFIVKHQNKLNAKVLIGEGGSFDYDQLGGSIKRAPAWMRKLSLEWLWRLVIQPKRIRRQLAIPNFIKQVRKEKRSQK